MSLKELGKEILAINRANGWNVPVLEDWTTPEQWDLQAVAGSSSEYAWTSAMDPSEVLLWNERARYKIPTSLALIHSEVSEALEEFRKEHRLEHFGEELADVLIRTVELGTGLGIDLDAAVAAKLEKNRQRTHRHGGRLI